MAENHWTNQELLSALQSYLFLLSSQIYGVEVDKNFVIKKLLSTSLPNRTRASVRYRFRNLSHLFSKKNFVTLKGYTPAPQVGSGVELRIDELLSHYPKEYLSQFSVMPEFNLNQTSLSEQVIELEKNLADINKSQEHRGHNNPPELIDIGLVPLALIEEMEEIPQSLRNLQEPPSKAKSKIEELRTKLWDWISLRLTKFIDATLYVAAPLILAKLFGLSEILSKLSGLLKLM